MIALALWLLAAPAAAAPARNVVLVSIDALRADRLERMPRLSRWARESAVFTEAVAQAPWTLPSMMSAFTSLYPHRHKVLNRFDPLGYERREPARLAAGVTTLAEALKAAGLETAAFTGDAGLDGEFGFARGFDVYFDSRPFAGFETTGPLALDWIKSRRGRFFAFVHGYDAHGQGPAAGSAREPFLEARRRSIEEGPREVPPAERRRWEKAYESRVAAADAAAGRFLEALAGVPGLLETTAVVVISDHGEELYEHGRLDHGMTLYDEALRVPFLVRAPGLRPERRDGQVRLLDLGPTVLELLGVRSDAFAAQAQGVSLVPALRGKPVPPLDALAETDFLLRAAVRALRSPDGRKLVFDLDTLETAYYDLRRDPGERRPAVSPPRGWEAMMGRLRALLDVPPEKAP